MIISLVNCATLHSERLLMDTCGAIIIIGTRVASLERKHYHKTSRL